MRIEDLVPPLELCKQIPEGKFADSALVWCEDEDGLELVMPREIAEFEKEGISAPTLQEILKETDAIIDISLNFHKKGEYRFVWARKLSNGQFITNDNPATAALKLWLELERGGE